MRNVREKVPAQGPTVGRYMARQSAGPGQPASRIQLFPLSGTAHLFPNFIEAPAPTPAFPSAC